MAGLLDFIQGASNAAASNVSAPVDGIAWLLRKAGLPIPASPVGGSDWMAQNGLTRQTNGVAGLLGESVGGVLPMVAQAGAPQIAKGLLSIGDNLSAPSTLNKQAGVIRARFVENPSQYGSSVKILDDGTAVIEKRSSGFESLDDFRQKVFEAAREKYGTQYDHYFRFTNNPKELDLAKSGALRPSMNHADGFMEKGLSVADGPHYGAVGYKYGYPVMGRHVGWGSDGEPLIDPKTVNVLSDRLFDSIDLMRKDKEIQEEILKKAGLSIDYFDGVQFLNNPHTFK